MKLLKRLLLAVLISSSLLLIIPTTLPNLQSSYTVQAASTKINISRKTLYIANTYTLKVIGAKQKISWSSSNRKVATVNSKGKVTAKKKGTATITAKVGNKRYKCTITVKQRKSTVKSQAKSSTVYITNTGSKYHRSSCSYLRKSKIATTLKSAKSSGYTACSRCHP